jgi:hypothetical protein
MVQIVIEPEKRAGVVLVTANNPHLTRLPRSTAFCPDRCEELGWAAQLTARNKVTLLSSTFLSGYGTVHSGIFVSFLTLIGFFLYKSFWYGRPFFFFVQNRFWIPLKDVQDWEGYTPRDALSKLNMQKSLKF